MQKLDNKELMPVILLGAGRSGTKFLRSVLASSSEVVAVPYDVGYVWRYGNESISHDQFTSEMLKNNITAYIRNTLPKLANRIGKPHARFMVEKSVPNTLRPNFVYSIYPEAKYIHLIRDGRAVTESSMRMWVQPADKSYLMKKLKYFPWSNYKYAWWYLSNMVKGKFSGKRGQHIWGPRYIGIDEDAANLPLATVCSKQWRMCVEIAQQQLKQIPTSQIMEVRYEELMNDSSCLEKLCDFIGIKDKQNVLQYFESHVDVKNLSAWKSRLSQESYDLIMTEISETLNRLGYNH
ncbi:Sulfotransferase family protein [Mariprofundus ferrinatatus]|uniref:Sulfotransferase family protein n=1 Tax=Mariprofundus ferrinatatus TaxID=1921087 RepID=A0A2K8L431_9PROT|nr:sulfotransferase [Mariprofundus ferrinatatus]ATX82003.1 Sulfotransferase family protein [Mariprofundus ferrinatatus]